MQAENQNKSTELKEKKKEITQIKEASNKKLKELSDDLAALYLENKELIDTVKTLSKQLDEFKQKSPSYNDTKGYLNVLKENMPMVIIGKNKVKVPKLNFAALSPAESAKLKVVEYYDNDENNKATLFDHL